VPSLGAQAAQGQATLQPAQNVPAAAIPKNLNGQDYDPQLSGGEAAANVTPSPGAFGFWDLLRMLLVLILVVAAIYGVFFLLKRGKKQVAPDSELINILGTTTLSGNRSLHVVSIGKQLYIIGSADGGVTLIDRVDDKESADEIRLQAGSINPNQNKSFSELLGTLFGGQGSAKGEGGLKLMRDGTEKLRKLREKKPDGKDGRP